MTTTVDKRAKNEIIKENSRLLRGGIAEGLAQVVTGAIEEDDTQLLKFHGSYMQDDRDIRAERGKKKLEKAYTFMIRLRIPGGLVSAKQWIALDDIATTYANHTLRLTTRATFQYHGIIKSNLKRTMQAINAACLDSIAACGDVNRNVMSAANPYLSKAHRAAYDLAKDVSDHLLPKTGAYHEIWLDGEQVIGKPETSRQEKEPIYGTHYLPRKFKIVIAVPPDNDVDAFAHDIGFFAIVEKGEVVGWNISAGGGMGMTHGETDTFPRLGDMLGFCTTAQAVDVAEKIMTVQRDWGNRELRKNARFKYTVERVGIDAVRTEVEKRLGTKLGNARPMTLTYTGDRIGWHETIDTPGEGRTKADAKAKAEAKKWHLTLYIANGRIKDVPGLTMRKAMREIAEAGMCEFVVTSNQNLILANVTAKNKPKLEAILAKHGVSIATSSGLRRNSMACVALPTCGLALAESERFLPELITALEDTLDEAGLRNDDIMMRMTGCPNGCARPYLSEIGLVGRNPGLYNLYLGAAFDGTRLSKLYAQDVGRDKIISLLSPLLKRYAKERQPGEHFGNFVVRAGVVEATTAGNNFHMNVKPAT